MAAKSDIRSQSKKIIYSVYNHLKDLVNSRPDATIREIFASTQEATADACSCNVRTVQRICAEARRNEIGTEGELQPQTSYLFFVSDEEEAS